MEKKPVHPRQDSEARESSRAKKQSLLMFAIVGLVLAALLFLDLGGSVRGDPDSSWENNPPLSYTAFLTALHNDQISQVTLDDRLIRITEKDGVTYYTAPVNNPQLLGELQAHNVEVYGEVEGTEGGLPVLLWGGLLVALGIGIIFWRVGASRTSGATNSYLAFGKSKARVLSGEQTGVTFADVGGADEAILELREITAFLQDPDRLQGLGGKMPKGVLLVGPPGTGKTLLARATAGEAGVPFYSLSGSEFVEMFVGVGAARVRDLFAQAKKTTPCIIFVDEIDAIGARRSGADHAGAHEEREQTLNQLLAEMDGFESVEHIVMMAATNRPELLDPALLRPGRFDRRITVNLPDLAGRLQVLRIHARGVTLAPSAKLEILAAVTPGFSGADLANVLNEAALLAARRGKTEVEMADCDDAIERVVTGSQQHAHLMKDDEKRTVAVHEAGHALAATLLPDMDRVHKVTIVARGQGLGYTWQRPTEDRFLLGEVELRHQLIVMLGGRVAERIVFGAASTGAADDLSRATDLARRMITEFGMSSTLGQVRWAGTTPGAFLSQHAGLDARISPETAAQVDNETRRFVEEAAAAAETLLTDHRAALDALAARLCAQETLNGDEIQQIVADTCWANPAHGAAIQQIIAAACVAGTR